MQLALNNALPADLATLVATVTNSHGTMLSAPLIQINPETGGPRLALSFDPGKDTTIEFRAQLAALSEAYSEVWLYRWTA